MYYLKFIIESVQYFSVHKENLLYQKNNKILLNNEIFKIDNEKILGGYVDFQGIINIVTENKVFWFLEKKNKLLFISKHQAGLLNIINEDGFRLNRTDEMNYAFFDVKRGVNKEIFKLKFAGNYPLLIKNEILFFHDFPNSIIECLYLRTENYKWKLDLSEHGDIRKILGVAGDILWITLYRAGKSKDKEILLAINVNSGEIVWILPEELPISDVHIKLIEDKQTIVSIKSGISTSFIDSYFVEIDALTGKVIRNQTIKAFEKENLKIGLWQFQEDKIYFTANKDFLNATHIGVLDYTTLDLLWFEEVKDRKAGLKEIQVSLDKIYVLDQGNQLHIYEQE